MTDDQIQDLVDAATELLGESDAMEPHHATKQQSLNYLEGIQSWARSSARALREEISRGD